MLKNRNQPHDSHRRCDYVINNSKAWIFNKFPVRYTSPRMQRARRAKQQRTTDMTASQYPMSKVPVKFNPNATKSNLMAQHGMQRNKEANDKEVKPFIISCFVEKYELKERFKHIEVQRKICKHCNYENVFYKRNSVDDSKKHKYQNLDMNYERTRMNTSLPDMCDDSRLNKARSNNGTLGPRHDDVNLQTLARHREFLLQDKVRHQSETDSFEPRQAMKSKQRVIIQMPDIPKMITSNNNDDISYSNNNSLQKATLKYTHKKN